MVVMPCCITKSAPYHTFFWQMQLSIKRKEELFLLHTNVMDSSNSIVIADKYQSIFQNTGCDLLMGLENHLIMTNKH